MRIRHKNQDYGWRDAGVKEKALPVHPINKTRDGYKEFCRKHKIPYGKWGRLEVEE